MLGGLITTMRTKLIAFTLLVAGLNPRKLFGGSIGSQITATTKPANVPATNESDSLAHSLEREYLMWKLANRS